MNQYKLQERIDGGRGGFGEVYRAVRVSDGLEVAIKMLREAANASARAAFRREVELLRQFRHPHIVALLDSNLEAARPFYVMPLMRGGCLTPWAGRLPESNVRTAFAEIVDGVVHMHACGALHRDLKLDNVFVSASGHCAVGDLGLGNRPGCTMILTVAAIGTPGYMAPEIRAGSARASKTSDIYSLGALLFHLITGVHPNDATTLDPREYRTNIAADLRSLVLEMTNLEPTGRPTAGIVLSRLRAWRPTNSPRAPQPAASSGAASAVAVGLLLLLGIGIAAAGE
jgi:serine/threonine protein kinase